MATLRKKKKLAALNKESCEEYPRNNVAHKTRMFPDQKRTTKLKFLRKLRKEPQRSCSKSLVGQKAGY